MGGDWGGRQWPGGAGSGGVGCLGFVLMGCFGLYIYGPSFFKWVADISAGELCCPLIARGRNFLSVSAPAGRISYPYPHLSGRVTMDARIRGQNCHPYYVFIKIFNIKIRKLMIMWIYLHAVLESLLSMSNLSVFLFRKTIPNKQSCTTCFLPNREIMELIYLLKFSTQQILSLMPSQFTNVVQNKFKK